MAAAGGDGDRASRVAAYLSTLCGGPVEVVSLRPLKSAEGEASDDPKELGYGVPLEAECRRGRRDPAIRGVAHRPTQGFGHDYPADRAWQALYGHAAYNGFPRHVRSLDVGFVRESGELVSAGDAAEFFQLVDKAAGHLYWLDLDRLLSLPLPRPRRGARPRARRFLAECHADKRDEPTLYQRRIRELVGHGECLMGILDSYPHPYPLLPPTDCEALERAARVLALAAPRPRASPLADARRLPSVEPPLPRRDAEFSVLDRSRGEWGEPADDVERARRSTISSSGPPAAQLGARGVAEPFVDLLPRVPRRLSRAERRPRALRRCSRRSSRFARSSSRTRAGIRRSTTRRGAPCSASRAPWPSPTPSTRTTRSRVSIRESGIMSGGRACRREWR